jgi:electron transfer flavoprotein alpha subunit
MEYTAHGADRILAVDHPSLTSYSTEHYLILMEKLVRERDPDILLIGATDFGREFAPRLAKRLHTGLSADCVGLDLTPDGLLVQIAPSFGGNMLAEIVTEKHRPQMATVRPGTFREIPHNNERTAVVERLPLPAQLPPARVRQIQYERAVQREHTIENANVIVCGGRGLGNKNNFRKLDDLAKLLGGDVGATRPVVYAGWAGHDVLIGQAGKHIKPKILFSFGISGAIQHTAGLGEADFIVAVNKNPQATMMRMADVAVVADAADWLNHLVKELRRPIRE